MKPGACIVLTHLLGRMNHIVGSGVYIKFDEVIANFVGTGIHDRWDDNFMREVSDQLQVKSMLTPDFRLIDAFTEAAAVPR